MAVEAYLPKLSVILFSAAIDSINPCAIGVLLLLIAVLLATKRSLGRMLFLGGVYVLAVFIVYLLAGFGLLYFLANIPLYLTEYLSIAVALLIVFAGLVEIKDFFWYARGFTLAIPARYSSYIHKMSGRTSVFGIALLGAFVSAVELPCTGAPYLAIITLLAQNFDAMAFTLLLVYNIVFVSPLIIILLLVACGKRVSMLRHWHKRNKPYMRLATGLLLIVMGWLLMLIANGTINLG